jgi:hypothetical protein
LMGGYEGASPVDIARRLWLETHPLAVSASRPEGDGAPHGLAIV